MLIGRDYISNDIITLGMCLQCLFTVAHRGIGSGIQLTVT